MGGGLVLFGIGGSVSGGLFDAVGLTGGGGNGTSANKQLQKQEAAALRRTRVNPRDEAAFVTLTRVRYQQAGQGDNFDKTSGQFTSGGRKELAAAAQSWQRYVALNPKSPDPNLAALMVQAFSPLGLNHPNDGVAAAEIVADARPSAQSYYQLALFAYAAKQTRKGDLAGRKAIELAPKEQRAAVKSQIDTAKSSGGFPSATGQ
jgi:hypothetical protein